MIALNAGLHIKGTGDSQLPLFVHDVHKDFSHSDLSGSDSGDGQYQLLLIIEVGASLVMI